LLAIALLNWSDDEGYFMANPTLIRGQLFPFEEDSKKVPRSLQELSEAGWILLGTDSQKRAVGKVMNFLKHQRVDKPKPSEIKGCSTFQEPSTTHLIVVPSGMEGNRREGNGGGGEESPPPTDGDWSGRNKRIATFPEILRWGKAQMPPTSDDCCEAFFDRMEAEGWITKEGHPLNDWIPRFRSWIKAWHENAASPNRKTK
jgi:hypothetical protein